MTGDDWARFIYLGLLILFIGGALFAGRRLPLGETVKQALIWISIFLALIFAYSQRDILMSELAPGSSGELSLRRSGGGFEATLQVNGTPVHFFVDTGASYVVLSRDDAVRVGFDPDRLSYHGQAMTANGVVSTAPVTLERVEFEGVVERNVPAVVNSGELPISLLGMSYLNRFEDVRIKGDWMLLNR